MQKKAYEVSECGWRSEVCSSYLLGFDLPTRPVPFRSSHVDMRLTVGLGIISFDETELPPEVTTGDYVYHTDTEVITSVVVKTGGAELNPDNMGYAIYHRSDSLPYKAHLRRRLYQLFCEKDTSRIQAIA